VSDLRNNIGIGPVKTNVSGATLFSGGLANAFGRTVPRQSNGNAIVGQVVADLYTQDDLGIAFPAGTLWVRLQSRYSGGGDGIDDNTFYWVAVPASLPAGYTYNPKRNVGPTATATFTRFSGSIWTTDHLAFAGQDGVDYAPTYNPTAPIRTAAGIYTPLSSTTSFGGSTHVWGPHNFNNLSNHFDMSNPSTGTNTYYLPLHPGYRNVRIKATWTAGTYAGVGATAGVTYTLDGVTYTINKSDFVLTAGEYVYTIDTGASTQTAAGVLRQIVYTEHLFNFPAPGTYGGCRTDLYMSPRVDIPLPWSATTGNVHAPGGILTGGNIPGF
jgi:hypothetical protein